MVEIIHDNGNLTLDGIKLIDCEYVAEQETTSVKESVLVPDENGQFTGINTRFVTSTVVRLKPIIKNFVVDENNVINIEVPKETKKGLVPKIKNKK